MSGFNTIKKSRKRSHEIEEKLNVLNRELEKTKDIQEQPAMNTSGLYTPVQQSLPQDPVQVDTPDPDQSTGATTNNWTQPVGDGEDGFTQSSAGSGEDGHAPSYSDTSQLFDSGTNKAVFQSPNGISGAAASFGAVSYTHLTLPTTVRV